MLFDKFRITAQIIPFQFTLDDLVKSLPCHQIIQNLTRLSTRFAIRLIWFRLRWLGFCSVGLRFIYIVQLALLASLNDERSQIRVLIINLEGLTVNLRSLSVTLCSSCCTYRGERQRHQTLHIVEVRIVEVRFEVPWHVDVASLQFERNGHHNGELQTVGAIRCFRINWCKLTAKQLLYG